MHLSISKIIPKVFDGSFVKFKDRDSAAELLSAVSKRKLKNLTMTEVLILGIPKGGIIIGNIIAKKFGYRLEMVIPKRIVAPNNRELAIGAIMKDNTFYLNSVLQKKLHVDDKYINLEKEKQLNEIKKIESLIGEQIKPEKIKGKTVFLVDDGVATGSTLFVTSIWIRKYNPKNLTILIPICPSSIFKLLKKEADDIETILKPSSNTFVTVDHFYQNFDQLNFEMIGNILKKYQL